MIERLAAPTLESSSPLIPNLGKSPVVWVSLCIYALLLLNCLDKNTLFQTPLQRHTPPKKNIVFETHTHVFPEILFSETHLERERA